jgi:diguanylate cyclase (GGDEF)-like protein
VKLQSKILVTLFATLFAVSGLTFVIYYTLQKSQTIAETKQANIQLSKIEAAQLDQVAKDWSSILTYIQKHRIFTEYLKAKASGSVQRGYKAALEEFFLTVSISHPDLIKYIRFIDKEGTEEILVKNQEIKRVYKDRTNREYFSGVIGAPAFEISRPSFRKGDDYIAMDWGMAVSHEGKTLGVLTMTLNPNILINMFEALLIKGLIDDVYVTDWNGLYLFNTRHPKKVFNETAEEHTEAFTLLMKGETGAVMHSSYGEVMSYHSHAPFGVRFMLATSEATMVADTMTLLKRMAILMFLTAGALCAVILFFIKRMIVTRLQYFNKVMSKVSRGDLDGRDMAKKAHEEVASLALNESDELGDLSRTFITMSDRLQSTQNKLDMELQRLQNLVKFGRLVGNEVSEEESYSILLKYLSRSFGMDRIVVVSLSNSENIAEVIATYGDEQDEASSAPSCSTDLQVIQDTGLCRAVRSGQDFVVNDVTVDYRCPYQEVNQAEGSYMCAPISTGGAVLGWIHLVSLQKNFFDTERCFMINSYISTIAPSISSIRLLKAHRNMAMRDSLTGLYNRRFLEESISAQVPFAARYSQPLSLMMIDIDHFKRFNDLYGHKQGDEIMQKVSNVLTDTARDSDIVSRYGGEEFVVIMPNTTKEGGIKLAEKIRCAIETKTMLNMNGTKEVTTVSIGLSTFPEDADDVPELMRQVDIALYKSKSNGRNLVTATQASAEKKDPGKKAS